MVVEVEVVSISVFTNSADEVAAAIENPCRQDCERRCAGCHAKCQKYLEYQAYRQTVYAARAKAEAMKGPTPGKRSRLREADRDRRSGHRHK